jgi:hypothetical protein
LGKSIRKIGINIRFLKKGTHKATGLIDTFKEGQSDEQKEEFKYVIHNDNSVLLVLI